METASNGTDTISYNYTADGIRTSKTVNGVVHTYYYSGGLLRRETYGDTTLDFFYDTNGTPFSMLQNRSAMYYYITNLQGDVIRLVDYLGNTAAYYEYDPHGNAIKASGSHCNINPLRYRGYYYDSESGLYYLQSRYYDPQVGRFINADAYVSTGQGIIGYNMFAYCLNSPIALIDCWGDRAVLPELFGSVIKEEPILAKLSADLQNFDINNTDPQIVYDANYVSVYKGVPVIRHSSDYLTSWAIKGVIFLNHSNDEKSSRENTLNHEYGHIMQEREYGSEQYITSVFIPSTIYNVFSRGNPVLSDNYYNMPWEYNADVRGGVNRQHAPWAGIVSNIYFELW